MRSHDSFHSDALTTRPVKPVKGRGESVKNLSARVNNCTEAAYYSAYRTSSELNTTPTNRAVGVNFCCYFTLALLL